MIKKPKNFKINLQQAAELAGQSRHTVRNRLLDGTIKAKRIHKGTGSFWEVDFLSAMKYAKTVEK